MTPPSRELDARLEGLFRRLDEPDRRLAEWLSGLEKAA